MQLGKVIRPEYGDGDATVVLTASLSKGLATGEKKFIATVKQAGMSDEQSTQADSDWLDIPNKDNIIVDIDLPLRGPNGSDVSWSSDKTDVTDNNGKVVRPENGSPTADVVMTATITKGESSIEKVINIKVLPWTDEEEANNDSDWLIFEVIRGMNTKQDEIRYDLKLVTEGPKGSTIEWKSSDKNDIINPVSGKYTAPKFTLGNPRFIMQATITKGLSIKIKSFSLRGISAPITNSEVVDLATNLIDETSVRGSNLNVNNFKESVELFSKIEESVAPEVKTAEITWRVCDPDTGDEFEEEFEYANITGSGSRGKVHLNIIRPANEVGNVKFTLEATAISAAAAGDRTTKVKSLDITIIAEGKAEVEEDEG